MSREEWDLRVDLAACCRLLAHFGLDELIQTHSSARLAGEDRYLINPYGLMFREVTASSLVKVDMQGRVAAESPYTVHPAAFALHGAVFGARPDVAAVVHVHTEMGVAVASVEEGLLPLTQTALFFHGRLAYHDYEGLTFSAEEAPRFVSDLGRASAMILRHHGTVTVAPTVAEAWTLTYYLERACRMQVASFRAGSKPRVIAPALQDRVRKQLEDIIARGGMPAFGTGEWPTLLRMLDSADASFRQ